MEAITPTQVEYDDIEQKALDIFGRALSSTPTPGTGSDPAKSNASQEIIDWLLAVSSEQHDNILYGIWRAIETFATGHPAQIDRVLSFCLRTADMIPLSITSDYYGSGSTSLTGYLSLMVTEIGHRGYLSWSDIKDKDQRPGTEDGADTSKIKFSKADVVGNFAGVQQTLAEMETVNHHYMAAQAIRARYIVLKGCSSDPLDFKCAFKPPRRSERWNRVIFIGSLIELRAQAKCLSEVCESSEDNTWKMDELREELERWIYDPQLSQKTDSIIQRQVMLTLSNLHNGPFNETSENIFTMGDWWT